MDCETNHEENKGQLQWHKESVIAPQIFCVPLTIGTPWTQNWGRLIFKWFTNNARITLRVPPKEVPYVPPCPLQVLDLMPIAVVLFLFLLTSSNRFVQQSETAWTLFLSFIVRMQRERERERERDFVKNFSLVSHSNYSLVQLL